MKPISITVSRGMSRQTPPLLAILTGGLLAAIFVSPGAPLAGNPNDSFIAMLSGGPDETAGFNLLLDVRGTTASCAVNVELIVEFPSGSRQSLRIPASLSDESPFARRAVPFQPDRDTLREPMLVFMDVTSLVFSGCGSCAVLVNHDIFDTAKGITRDPDRPEKIDLTTVSFDRQGERCLFR